MLVAPVIRDILFYGGFAVGVVGLICVAIGGDAAMKQKKEKKKEKAKATEQAPLPEAVLANQRPRNAVLWQLLGAFALIGGPAASIWLWFHTSHIVFVRNGSDAHTPTTSREVWIGGEYPVKRSLDPYPHRRATWIVNESSSTLTAQTIGYGDAHTWPAIAIPPGASLPVVSVDYVGPDDTPPGVITVKQVKEVANAGIPASAQRVWLTWE